MPLYLVEDYIGSGTYQDPWRPIDETGWSAIKLGPGGPTVRALVWLPTSSSDPRLRLLGDDKTEAVAAATRVAISARINVDVTAAVTLADVVLAILERPPATGYRWPPLRPTRIPDLVQRRLLRWQVWLAGELWVDTPVIAGGATYGDTFDGTANPIGGQWSTAFGASALQRVSGRARASVVGSCASYLNPVGFGSDQYLFMTIFHTVAGSLALGTLRAATGDYSSYFLQNNPTNYSRISEADGAGSPTTLASAAEMATGSVMRFEASGPTLSGYDDGVLTLGPVTDTTLTSGRIQIGIVPVAATTEVELDDFHGGDFFAPDIARLPNTLRPGIFQPGIAR